LNNYFEANKQEMSSIVSDFRMTPSQPPKPPKAWKFALLVWCFIYPVITILSMTILPLMQDFPGPIKTLTMSLILVPLMAFFYIPFIQKKFFHWLRK